MKLEEVCPAPPTRSMGEVLTLTLTLTFHEVCVLKVSLYIISNYHDPS